MHKFNPQNNKIVEVKETEVSENYEKPSEIPIQKLDEHNRDSLKKPLMETCDFYRSKTMGHSRKTSMEIKRKADSRFITAARNSIKNSTKQFVFNNDNWERSLSPIAQKSTKNQLSLKPTIDLEEKEN